MGLNRWNLAVLLALAALSVNALAAYRVDTELELPNRKHLIGSVTVQDGESASIRLQDAALDFSLKPNQDGTVFIQSNVHHREAGRFRSVAKPQLITQLNQTSEMSELTKDGKLIYRLRVSAERVH